MITMDNHIKYLFVLTLLRYSLACINLHNNLGDLWPPIAYVEVGKDLEFTCQLDSELVDKGEIEASEVYFKFKHGKPTVTQKVDQRNIHILDAYNVQLRIQNVSLHEDGVYSCYTTKSNHPNENEEELICISDAYIGFKPRNISDFKCVSYQSKKMECTWSIPPNNPKFDNNYTLFSLYHGIDRNECEQIKISGQRAMCTFTALDFQYMYYTFKLISQNELGNKTQHFQMNTSSILKLNPPKNVTFQDNILSWKSPNQDFLIVYQINVSINGKTVENIELVDTSDKLWKSYVFDNLKPNTNYTFSISCKINDPFNNYWSDIVWNSTKTNPTVPSRPPRVISQAFESKLNLINNTRFIILYWQDLPTDEKNGDNLSYFITYSVLNEESWQNVTTEGTKAEFSHLSINSSYEFRIYSQNEIGTSSNYSKMILPSNDQMLQSSSNLNIVVDNLKYQITWEKSSKNVMYALFWCIPGNKGHCDRHFDWTLTNQSGFNITLDSANYMFGISISDGTNFSPMAWEMCKADYQQKKIDFNEKDFNIQETSSNSILITWKLECKAQYIFVHEFVIQLQKCKSDQPSRDCGTAIKFTTHSRTEEFLINDLEPNTYYHIRVKANGLIGGEEPKVTRTKPPRNPLNVKIIEANNLTLKLQWKVPNLDEHQLISVFRVEFFQKEAVVLLDACEEEHCFYNITLPQNLTPYTDYPIYVLACRQNCSNLNEIYYRSEVFFKTKPSFPGLMELPIIESINSSKLRIHIKPPSKPNGPINYYYVLIHENDGTLKEYRHVKWKNMEYIDQPIEECPYYIFSKDRIFDVAVRGSNLLLNSNEEYQGNYTSFQSITLHCKSNVISAIFIILICLICSIVSISVIIYCGYSYFENLKKKDDSIQIPLQIEKFLNREPDARDEQNLDSSKNISTSVTNTSMTSESSGENSNTNSNSTDRNMTSFSENHLFSIDSGVNDMNYRDNHEYYFDCDDSTQSFLDQQEKRPFIEPVTQYSKQYEYSPRPDGENQQYKTLVSQTSPVVNKSPSTYVSQAEASHYLPHSPLLNNTSQV